MKINTEQKTISCSSDFIFISCILSKITLTLFIDVIFPRELIILILSYYYFLETHVNIIGIDRKILYEFFWRFVRKINREQKYYKPDYQNYLISKNLILIKLDIYQKSNVLDVSLFDEMFGKSSSLCVMNMIYKWMNRPSFGISLKKSGLKKSIVIGQKVLIRNCHNDVVYMGIIISIGNLNATITLFDVKITETFVFYYDIGTIEQVSESCITIVEPMLKVHQNEFLL